MALFLIAAIGSSSDIAGTCKRKSRFYDFFRDSSNSTVRGQTVLQH